MASAISSIGLGFDIIGVVLLFKYGLAPNITESGANYLTWGHDKAEQEQYRHYRRMGRVGLGLLLTGFSLQMASNFI